MSDETQGNARDLIEIRLAGKLHLIALLSGGEQEELLQDYAKRAFPEGTSLEREDWKRYWRARLDQEKQIHLSRELSHQQERIARNDWSKGRTQSTVERKLPKDLSDQPPVISKLQGRNRDQKSDHRNERRLRIPVATKRAASRTPIPRACSGEKPK